MRERRPFETRKDYIREALDAARAYAWDTFHEMSELAWRMLDENPKTRIELPTAAAAAAAALSLLSRQAAAADVSYVKRAAATEPGRQIVIDASRERVRPAKRVAAEERSRRLSVQERRRRFQYAPD